MDYKRFEDYKEAVIEAYEKKKTEGTLPHNLLHHTDANLKKEVLEEFATRYLPRDNEIFKNFFGRADNREQYFKKVNDCKPSLFRPLNIFLKEGKARKTHNRNIEMLAWLTDFHPRPFVPGDPYDFGVRTPPVQSKPEDFKDPLKILPTVTTAMPGTNDHQILNPEIPGQGFSSALPGEGGDEPTVPVAGAGTSGIRKLTEQLLNLARPVKERPKSFLAGLVIATSVLILYIITKPYKMYWNGNEYRTVLSYQNMDGTFIVPIDTFQLRHQKRITDLSSITRNHIGIVYYSRLDWVYKFYTVGGTNPEDTSRRLLPLSEGIYKNHVLNQHATGVARAVK